MGLETNRIRLYNLIEHLKGSLNPADLPSRQPNPVPPGYYGEQLVDPLYTTQHGKIMQLIIDTINKRQRKEKEDKEEIQEQQSITSQDVSCCQTFFTNRKIQNLNAVTTRSNTQNHNPISVPTSPLTPLSPDNNSSQDSMDEKHNGGNENIHISQTPSQEEHKEDIETIIVRQYEFKTEAEELEHIEHKDEQLENVASSEDASLINNVNPTDNIIPLDDQISKINENLSLHNMRLWQAEDPQIQKIRAKLHAAEEDQPIHKLYTEKDGLLYISNKILKERTTTNKNKLRHLTIRKEHSLIIPNMLK